MTTMLEAALAYAKKGWPIFPANEDKSPATKNGVLDATTNPDTITAWWTANPEANIALDVGGAGMMVLDFDPGSSMEELENACGKLPDTSLVAHTPRGGEHLYFSLGSGEVVAASASKLAPHVDVRSFHSYVLLPPSSTSAGIYKWENDGKAAYRSDEIYRLANSAKEKHEDRDNWLIKADLPAGIRDATAWLSEVAKPAIEGQGGDHTTYATAAMLKSYGCSQDKALELLMDHWNSRCQPPWEADELTVKVAHAYRYNTSPPGNLTQAYKDARTRALFKPVAIALPSGDERIIGGQFRFADREAMNHIKTPNWIIDDFIPDEGYAMLFGPWGTFKTFLALDIALRIACEYEPADDLWTSPSQGAVLFAAGEGRSNIIKRVKAWETVHNEGEAVYLFTLVDPVPMISISQTNFDMFCEEALRRHPNGYRLVVIDTIGKAMMGLDENSQQAASEFTNLVQRLRLTLGGSVLALHHTGHNEDARARGSSVFGADPDAIIGATRQDKEKLVKLIMTKQKDAPEWDKPRYAKLNLSGDTLVPSLPSAAEMPKAVAQGGIDRDILFMRLLDTVVAEILKSNPSRGWSQSALSKAAAWDERISCGSKQLANDYLCRLREANDTIAHQCFDPNRSQRDGQWRWRDS